MYTLVDIDPQTHDLRIHDVENPTNQDISDAYFVYNQESEIVEKYKLAVQYPGIGEGAKVPARFLPEALEVLKTYPHTVTSRCAAPCDTDDSYPATFTLAVQWERTVGETIGQALASFTEFLYVPWDLWEWLCAALVQQDCRRINCVSDTIASMDLCTGIQDKNIYFLSYNTDKIPVVTFYVNSAHGNLTLAFNERTNAIEVGFICYQMETRNEVVFQSTFISEMAKSNAPSHLMEILEEIADMEFSS